MHDQFPGFFRWFFEYSSRGSQVPHCAQCFPLVARSAAVTAADILSAAWASRSSRSGARGGVREESPMISIAQESDSTASIRDGTFREKPEKPELGRKTNSAAQKHANTPLVEQLDV